MAVPRDRVRREALGLVAISAVSLVVFALANESLRHFVTSIIRIVLRSAGGDV